MFSEIMISVLQLPAQPFQNFLSVSQELPNNDKQQREPSTQIALCKSNTQKV